MLPKDLLLFCRKKFLMRVVPCIILTALFATILILWGNLIFNTDIKEFQISCYIVFMLIPFAITGVPYKLIDATYYGTVKKVKITTTTDNDSSFKPVRELLYQKNTINLIIEKPDGSLIYKKVYSGKAQLQQNLSTYHEGDSVFHLYGTKTTIVLPDANSTTVHCAVCGSSNHIEYEKCRNCGHSLIKKLKKQHQTRQETWQR